MLVYLMCYGTGAFFVWVFQWTCTVTSQIDKHHIWRTAAGLTGFSQTKAHLTATEHSLQLWLCYHCVAFAVVLPLLWDVSVHTLGSTLVGNEWIFQLRQESLVLLSASSLCCVCLGSDFSPLPLKQIPEGRWTEFVCLCASENPPDNKKGTHLRHTHTHGETWASTVWILPVGIKESTPAGIRRNCISLSRRGRVRRRGGSAVNNIRRRAGVDRWKLFLSQESSNEPSCKKHTREPMHAHEQECMSGHGRRLLTLET